MTNKQDILDWMRTTFAEYPGFSGSDSGGGHITLLKYLDGRFVIKVSGEEKFSGEDLDEAICEYHKLRGFPTLRS